MKKWKSIGDLFKAIAVLTKISPNKFRILSVKLEHYRGDSVHEITLQVKQ